MTAAGRSPAPPTLAEHLRAEAAGSSPLPPNLVTVLQALAGAGATLAREIARAALSGLLGETGEVNAAGDRVRRLDVWTNDLLLKALETTNVVTVAASEELETPVLWPRPAEAAPLAVCIDPLDGSLNTDVAGVVGTIFGVRPGPGPREPDPARYILGAGTRQIAAGYILYGPATVLVYAAGGRVHAFVLDPVDGQFRLTQADVRMPPAGRTYAVNDANWASWGPRGPRARRAAAGFPDQGPRLRPPVLGRPGRGLPPDSRRGWHLPLPGGREAARRTHPAPVRGCLARIRGGGRGRAREHGPRADPRRGRGRLSPAHADLHRQHGGGDLGGALLPGSGG